jgi:hypothetical protein
MANGKVRMRVGSVYVSGEREDKWLSEQLDSVFKNADSLSGTEKGNRNGDIFAKA